MIHKTGWTVGLLLAGGLASAALRYHVTDCGTLGGNSSWATGVNDQGVVTGRSTTSGSEVRAFRYTNGTMTNLGTLGGTVSWANGICPTSGAIVGWSFGADGGQHAFMTGVVGLENIEDYATGWTSSEATCVAGVFQIAGWFTKPGQSSRPFLFVRGAITELGSLGTGGTGFANGINASNHVVGASMTNAGYLHAFSYQDGVMRDLGTFGGLQSVANGVNSAGEIVGLADMPGQATRHAFLYLGRLRDIGVGLGQGSEAKAINDSGQIVGYYVDATGKKRGCIWLGGVARDLNDLLDASSAGYVIEEAVSISPNGMIAANGYTPDGRFRALLLKTLTYRVVNLSALGDTSEPYGINNLGQVVGHTRIAYTNRDHAYLYPGSGSLIDLGTLGGGDSAAYGINSLGQVVGWAQNAGGYRRAFLYSGGAMSDLGTLGGGESYAYGINDSGQIVGQAARSNGDPRAFLFSGGSMVDIGTLGGRSACAYGINNLGQVVGDAVRADEQSHAFLYWGGSMSDLGTLGGSGSSARAVNAFGEVAGFSQPVGDGQHGFLYSAGVMTDMGTLGAGLSSYALGLNASGQAAGGADRPDGTTEGFLYTNGAIYGLNSLLEPAASSYRVYWATGIADDGSIAGVGARVEQSPYEWETLLLIPNAGVAGVVSLQDYVGDVAQVTLEIEIRKQGTADVVHRKNVKPSANGSFTVTAALCGTYDVTAKGSHWLRKRLNGVVLSGCDFGGNPSFTLINGDVNGDNQVNLADLTAISRAWRSTPGAPNWNPNADLNGDGSVNLADWTIVSRNWRKSGDG